MSVVNFFGMFKQKLLVLFERFGPVGAIKLNSKSKGLKNVNGYCEFLKEC